MATVTIGGRNYEVEVRGESVVVDGHEYPVKVRDEGAYLQVNSGGVPYRVQLPPAGERESGMTVTVDYRPFTMQYTGVLGGRSVPRAPRASAGAGAAAAGRAAVKGGVTAQIAGRVLSVKVKPGDTVSHGDVLLILEAMKMENEVKSPADGTVK
ncbi:MAG TPA: biotin/lipoyl-containing protein, partial [Tepidiformaceae bacterium]|nr:biotin/lipoyl-containing protein [Tepidiformaceae bacterium]